MRSMIKRERSRSLSSERDGYNERTTRMKNERPSRFSGGLGGASGSGGNRGSRSRRVYVSNITFDATYMDVKQVFNAAGDVTFVQMLKDDNNRFKGCAVITFKEPEMAQEAIQSLNRQEFKGRKLVVKEEDANPDLKGPDHKRMRDDFDPRPIPLAPSLASIVPHQPMPNPSNFTTFGLSIQFLDSLKIDLPLINIVFVANLDYTVDADNLKEVFSLAGKVVECEIFKDKEGNSRGFGIVEYEHPVESVQAISMLHNQSFKDRSLTVRMDRSDRKKDLKTKLPVGLKSIGMGLGVNGDALKDVRSTNSISNLNHLSPMGQMNSIGSVAPPLNSGPNILDSLGPRLALGSGLGVSNRNFSRNQSSSSYSGGGGLGNIIQVSNLPMDYTNDSLRKLCWSYGDVRLAEMRSQGTGMIKFRSESDAQRAVDILDRQPMEGRLLNARVL